MNVPWWMVAFPCDEHIAAPPVLTHAIEMLPHVDTLGNLKIQCIALNRHNTEISREPPVGPWLVGFISLFDGPSRMLNVKPNQSDGPPQQDQKQSARNGHGREAALPHVGCVAGK